MQAASDDVASSSSSSSYQTAVYHVDAVPDNVCDAESDGSSTRSTASASSASFFAVRAYTSPNPNATAEPGELLSAYRSSQPSFDEEDGYEMYYTSGTTGRPKGVILSHRIVMTHAIGTIQGRW